ncbi:MAG: DNA cytosine methyltransferase [Saccharospirillaceae bacterium]|nr:DNA cytosine methyltransferase [Saccharospirillaceae bacterium]
MKHFEIFTLQKPSAKVGRINIENLTKLPEVGFPPGQLINVDYFPKLRKIVITADDNGTHIISTKNYKYRDGVRIGSRLDLRNQTIAKIFEGETELMMIYNDNRLVFCETPRSKSVRDRIEYMAEAIINGKLSTASLYAGVGCGDIGLADGFKKVGLDTELVFVNEIESKFVDTFTNNNPTYKKGKTVTAAMDIHELFPAAIPDVHMWSAGIICKSFSSLNVKNRDAPEWDENFGHLTVSTLMCLQMSNFKAPIIFIEQVVPYFNSLSFNQLKRILGIKGYTMHVAGDFNDNGIYKGVAGKDYGDIENRRRLFVAFVTNGINIDLDFMDDLARTNTTPITDLLDDPNTIPDKAFNIGASLKKKSLETDWKNRVVTDQVTSLSTISAGYGRVRIEDPKLLKDNNDPLGDFRLFTFTEVSRFKQLPEGLVDGVPAKRDQLTMLGNGLNGGASTAFFYAIGKSLTSLQQPWSSELSSFKLTA